MLCPSCGSANASEASICLSCGASLASNQSRPMTAPLPAPGVSAPPATSPSSKVVASLSPSTPSATTPSGDIVIAGKRIARLGDRLIALVLDTLLVAAVFALCGMWIAARWGGITENGFALQGKSAVLTFIATLVFALLYFWLMEGVFGATLGKAIIGVQVRSKNGERCDMRASLLRNLLRIVDGIGIYLVGFLIAIFSKLRQRLGDHLANTVVVETRIGTLARFVLVLLWMASIVAGMWGAYRIHSRAPIPARGEHVSPTGYDKKVATSSHSTLFLDWRP